MVFGVKREAPKYGPAFLVPAGEEDEVVLGEDDYPVFFEEDFATMFAELANPNKVMFEGGHDLGVPDR